MESEMDTVVPDTPPSRLRSRSPPQRFHRNVNRSLFRRVASRPSRRSERLESDPNVGGARDDSESVVQETVVQADNAVVPEMSRPLDDADMVVPEMVVPFDGSETLFSTSEIAIPDSRPRTVPKLEKFVLEILAIYCPMVLTLDL